MSIFKTDFESLLDPSERGNQVQYQPAIQEAQAVRIQAPEDKDSIEAMIAEGLEEAFPPFISIGKEWYRYSDGCWRKFTIEEYHPQIMESMRISFRNKCHLSALLETLLHSICDDTTNAGDGDSASGRKI